jgi:peptide/nickel transport system permease protein
LPRFIVSRIVQTIVVVFIVSLIAFSLLQFVPGDPARTILGNDATQEQIDLLRKELGLDRPIVVQYWYWLSNAVHGDFGTSMIYRLPVRDLFTTRLPITGYLSLIAFLVSIMVGIAAGIVCAIRRGSFLDQFVSLFANVGVAIPIFWLGVLGIYIFGLKLGLLPIQGWTSPLDDFWQSTKQAIMPVILLAVPSIALLARQTRSSMLEIISQDYIRTARSKGLAEQIIVFRHALKNAFIPIITLLGLQVRILVGGSVLVETVFNIPGMGRLLVTSAFNKDYLVMQGGVLILGLAVCLANLLVDISYNWIDPRMRYE